MYDVNCNTVLASHGEIKHKATAIKTIIYVLCYLWAFGQCAFMIFFFFEKLYWSTLKLENVQKNMPPRIKNILNAAKGAFIIIPHSPV